MPIYPPTSTPISATVPVTSSSVAAIPVPSHGPGGSFSIIAKTTISALASEVLTVLRDTKHWSEWNSFCPRCTIIPSKNKSHQLPKEGGGSETEQSKSNGGEKEKWLEGSEEDGWLQIGTTFVTDVYLNGDGLVEGKKRSRVTRLVVTRIEPINTSSLNTDTESQSQSEITGQQQPQHSAKSTTTTTTTTTKGYRIAWSSHDLSHWQLHSERVMELLEVRGADGEVRTEYACWETFGGILAAMVKRTVGPTLVDRFGDYARDLKGALEEKEGEGSRRQRRDGQSTGQPE